QTFLPEFMSMNAMMAGMAPVMSFLMMGRDMRAMVPTELLFWGVMSLGVIAGFIIAYPVNVWMVKRNLKHGLMTERTPGSRFDLGRQHQSKRGEGHIDHGTQAGAPSSTAGCSHTMKSDATIPQLVAVASVTA